MHWSVGQYDKAYKALRNAEECNLVDEKDEFEVGGREVYQKVAAHVAKYEQAEGRRRALANREKRKGREAQRADERDRLVNQLKNASATWFKYKTLEWNNSTMDPTLNGAVLDREVPNSLLQDPDNYKCVKQIEGLLKKASEIAEALPVNPRDLMDKHLITLNITVSDVAEPVQDLDMVCRREMIRRQQLEDALTAAEQKVTTTAIHEKAGKLVKGRLAKKKLIRGVGAHSEKKKVDTAKMKIEHAEKVRKAGEMKKQRAAAQRAMMADLDDFRDDDPDELDHSQTMEAEFNRKMFQSENDKFEEKKKAKLDAEERAMLAEKNAAKEELRQQRLYEMEQEKLAELKRTEERRREEEAVERAKMEKIEQFKAIKEAQYHQERLRQEQRDAVKNLARKKIEEDIAKERALLDEDEEDDADEQQRRKDCRKKLKIYHKTVLPNGKRGDVWEAVRTENVDMVKAYFMVQGTANLLKLHNYTDEGQGGRTLLHTACWWGCSKVIVLLMKLGAEINCIDTAMTKTTPLMEAARANKRTAVEILLRHGAAIRMQDAGGDTAVHWAARRGYGTLVHAMVSYAEKCTPGVSRRLMTVKNNRGREALDLAPNGTVRAIIERAVEECGGREVSFGQQLKKFKRGIAKAKVLGMNVGGDALKSIQNQHKRYGRQRTTRAAHLDLDGDGVLDDDQGDDPQFGQKAVQAHENAIAGGLGLSDLGIDVGLGDDDFFRR